MTPRQELDDAPNTTVDTPRQVGERKSWIPPHVKSYPVPTTTQGGAGAIRQDDSYYRNS